MSEKQDQPAQVQRRFASPAISLRSLLVLISLVTVGLAWQTSIYNRQARNIRTIRQSSGHVMHVWDNVQLRETFTGRSIRLPDKSTIRLTYNVVVGKGAEPKWYPFDFSGRWDICYVKMSYQQFDDEMIAFLKGLPSLKYLEPYNDYGYRGPYSAGKLVEINEKLKTHLPNIELVGREQARIDVRVVDGRL